MHPTLRAVAAVAVRTATLLVGVQGYRVVYEALAPEPVGADIGEGLLAFALMVLVALLWSAWDGARRPIVQAVVIWVATGLLTGGAMAASISLTAPVALDPGQVVTDLVTVGPFLAGLLVVPGVVGAAVAGGIRGGRRGAAATQ